MSTTYEIRCTKCKVMYWCGQSSQGCGYLYSPEKLYAFLHAHMGHPLIFNMSEFTPIDYKDVEPKVDDSGFVLVPRDLVTEVQNALQGWQGDLHFRLGQLTRNATRSSPAVSKTEKP